MECVSITRTVSGYKVSPTALPGILILSAIYYEALLGQQACLACSHAKLAADAALGLKQA